MEVSFKSTKEKIYTKLVTVLSDLPKWDGQTDRPRPHFITCSAARNKPWMHHVGRVSTGQVSCQLSNAGTFDLDLRTTSKLSCGKLCTLSLRFNSHFPGEPGLAGVYWSKGWCKWWWQLEVSVVQSSSQIITTNKPISSFFTGRLPFLSPNQQRHSTEGKISHPMDLLTPSSPGVFQLCLWPLIAPGYLRGGLPCLPSTLWKALMPVPLGKLCTATNNKLFTITTCHSQVTKSDRREKCNCGLLLRVLSKNQQNQPVPAWRHRSVSVRSSIPAVWRSSPFHSVTVGETLIQSHSFTWSLSITVWARSVHVSVCMTWARRFSKHRTYLFGTDNFICLCVLLIKILLQ